MRKKTDTGSKSLKFWQGSHFIGDIISKNGCVKVNGDLDGKIVSGNKVIIGKDGKITGDIVSEELIVYGTLKGDAKVSREARITSTGSLQGNIYLKNAGFAIDKGGIFIGKSLKNKPKKTGTSLNAANE